MNLLGGIEKRADEDYSSLTSLFVQYGDLEIVDDMNDNYESVTDVTIYGMLEKLEIENTDSNFMKIIEGILSKEKFDVVMDKFGERD